MMCQQSFHKWNMNFLSQVAMSTKLDRIQSKSHLTSPLQSAVGRNIKVWIILVRAALPWATRFRAAQMMEKRSILAWNSAVRMIGRTSTLTSPSHSERQICSSHIYKMMRFTALTPLILASGVWKAIWTLKRYLCVLTMSLPRRLRAKNFWC